MRLGILVALAGATASAFVWGLYTDSELDRERQPQASSTTATEALARSSNAQRARVFSAKDPLLVSDHLADPEPAQPAPASGRWAGVSRMDEPATPKRAVAPALGKNFTSLKPGDSDARAQLVRDIQYELKRVGCYSGEVHGSWNPGTKHAMKLFTDRVNATLPLEEPDYILLTLVQNEKPGTCGRGCPEGQLASGDGRCLPRAIVAQQRGGPKGIPAQGQDLAIGGSHHSASAPVPGRMAVGVPAGASERQEMGLDEARRIGTGQAILSTTSDDSMVPRSGLGAPGTDAQASAEVGQPPHLATNPQSRRNASTKRPRIQPGSTRQVFSNLTRYAP
jgi:hypothetical protein